MRIEIIELIAEGEKVVGALSLLGHQPRAVAREPAYRTALRNVSTRSISIVATSGRITEAWGLEDNRSRERQLGLSPRS